MIRLIISMAVVCSALAGTASAQTPPPAGSWEGEVVQLGPGTYSGKYPAKIAFEGNAGKIDYPSLSCGGQLQFIEARGFSFAYREVLTYGKDRCIQGGLVTVFRVEGGLQFLWTLDSVATAILKPSN